MLSNLSAADWENCDVRVFNPVPFEPDQEPDLFMPVPFESDPLMSVADASSDFDTLGGPI